jgi:hypothetical protein
MDLRQVILSMGIAFSIVASSTMTLAGESSGALGVPRSVQLQHEQIVRWLEHVAGREGPTAAAAGEAAALLKLHYAKEEKFALPPLGLLSTILKNPKAADLEQAVEMARRTIEAQEDLLNDHIRITTSMTNLIEAAAGENDQELIRLATRVAAQSLIDIEVLHPATVLIGEYIRTNLLKQK